MAKNETNNWPELAMALYDKLTGEVQVSYEFKNFELFVPAGVGAGTSLFIDGQLNITTKDEPKVNLNGYLEASYKGAVCKMLFKNYK